MPSWDHTHRRHASNVVIVIHIKVALLAAIVVIVVVAQERARHTGGNRGTKAQMHAGRSLQGLERGEGRGDCLTSAKLAGSHQEQV